MACLAAGATSCAAVGSGVAERSAARSIVRPECAARSRANVVEVPAWRALPWPPAPGSGFARRLEMHGGPDGLRRSHDHAGIVRDLVADPRAGQLRVLSTLAEFERLVVALGGCVLYPDARPDGRVASSVPLARTDARTAARWLQERVRARARVTPQVATNSVLIEAAPTELDRMEDALRRHDAGCE